MEDFLTIVGIPIVVLIFGLVVEYWVIQPIKHANEYSSVPSQYRRDWSTATTKALNKFKSQFPHYNGILQRRIFWIEEQEVKRGYSVTRISISAKMYFWESWVKNPIPNECYEMIIDRTGDILSAKPLPVERKQVGEKEKKSENPHTTIPKSTHPNPYMAYLYILVGLLGGSGGLSASAIFDYSSTSYQHPTNDSSYLWFYFAAILTGIALAVLADIYFRMYQAFAWQRLPLSLIIGFIGGWVGIFVLYLLIFVILGLIIFFIIAQFKS